MVGFSFSGSNIRQKHLLTTCVCVIGMMGSDDGRWAHYWYSARELNSKFQPDNNSLRIKFHHHQPLENKLSLDWGLGLWDERLWQQGVTKEIKETKKEGETILRTIQYSFQFSLIWLAAPWPGNHSPRRTAFLESWRTLSPGAGCKLFRHDTMRIWETHMSTHRFKVSGEQTFTR